MGNLALVDFPRIIHKSTNEGKLISLYLHVLVVQLIGWFPSLLVGCFLCNVVKKSVARKKSGSTGYERVCLSLLSAPLQHV